jgi:hypothetical protein
MIMESRKKLSTCFRCGAELNFQDHTPGRRDSCNTCGADVHVCKNCSHYDPKAYNECKEPQAERVVEKERSNFCDYFVLGALRGLSGAESKEAVFKQLDSLFKR